MHPNHRLQPTTINQMTDVRRVQYCISTNVDMWMSETKTNALTIINDARRETNVFSLLYEQWSTKEVRTAPA